MFLYQDYYDYFKTIAENLVDVSDFHRYNLLEFLGNKRNNNVDDSNYLLCLEDYTGGIEGEYIDNLRNTKRGAFAIIKKVTGQKKPIDDEKAEVINMSERLVLEVIAKMKYDKRRAHQIPELRFMGALDLTNIPFWQPTEIWKNYYGFGAEFTINTQAKLVMDKSLWKQN